MNKLEDFFKPQNFGITRKMHFSDFNKMFPQKFIDVTDKKSNPPRQYYIQKIFFVYLKITLLKMWKKNR